MPDIDTEIKKLSLKKGDILVIQRTNRYADDWVRILTDAGREAGIDFSVPFVFVDDINNLAVIRLEDIKYV